MENEKITIEEIIKQNFFHLKARTLGIDNFEINYDAGENKIVLKCDTPIEQYIELGELREIIRNMQDFVDFLEIEISTEKLSEHLKMG